MNTGCNICYGTSFRPVSPAVVSESPTGEYYDQHGDLFVMCECGTAQPEAIKGMYTPVTWEEAKAWAESQRTPNGYFVEAQ